MSTELPPTIDPVAAQRWSSLTAPSSPWLHEEVARRMEQRLQWIRLQPETWIHWEPLRGGVQAHGLLQKRYPRATALVIEPTAVRTRAAIKALSLPWWRPARWRAGPTRFELDPAANAQMLWANMALHMAADPQGLMAQWHRALAVDGFIMFSCFGPDTLVGLRQLYSTLGWPAASHEFTDMHDWGDMLVKAGFAEPVMDMERIRLSFESPQRLLQEMRGLGRNLNPQRHAGLRGKNWLAALHQALVDQLKGPEGDLVLEFEIIYGHAFKPAPRLKIAAESTVSLEQMRSALQQSKSEGR
ncbi:MAG: biotin synthase [Burkholderiaceae bacterium]